MNRAGYLSFPLAVYAISLILLYAASTTYHTFDISAKVNTILKKIDHMMIFILIAGSYTPICLITLKGRTGLILLSIVWGIAIVGILIKAFWVYCPKWVSSILYIGMGWICVLAFTQIFHSLSPAAFGWLLAGGIIYTIGGIIYALKLPIFNSKHKNFGSHEIFIFCYGRKCLPLYCNVLLCCSTYLYNRQFANKQNKGLQHRIFSGAATP